MYTCPYCQKIHNEDKFYCIECQKHYCSIECLKYQNSPEYDIHQLGDLSDMTFSCCGNRFCMKCYSEVIYYNRDDDIIYFCNKCNNFFHGDCYLDSLSQGDATCMCKLCIDLDNCTKNIICRKCHDEEDAKLFSFSNLSDIERYLPLDFSKCKKYKRLVDIVNSYSYNFLDCLSIKCDCKLCINVECNTTLMRLLFSDEYINDITNYWDMGFDIAPVEVLKYLAENSPNNCNCDICQFWKEYV